MPAAYKWDFILEEHSSMSIDLIFKGMIPELLENISTQSPFTIHIKKKKSNHSTKFVSVKDDHYKTVC